MPCLTPKLGYRRGAHHPAHGRGGRCVEPGGRLGSCRGQEIALTHYYVLMRQILSPLSSVNHRLPSGPAVMNSGVPEGTLNSVTVPAAAQAGRLLRLSRPTQATMAVRRTARRGRK